MDDEKKVDELWKESMEAEKEKLFAQEGEAAEQAVPEMDFINYISSLAYQAMIFLGLMASPITNKMETNLTQAKLLIDTLALLKEKTVNNLTEQEDALLKNTVYELQMKYVELSKGGNSEPEEGGSSE